MAFGDIIRRLTAVGQVTNPENLAFDGKYLYTILWLDGAVRKIDPFSGRVIRTTVGAWGSLCQGLTFDGKYLWISKYGVGVLLYQVDPLTMAVVRSYVCPEDNAGLYHDGKSLWVCNFVNRRCSLVDPFRGAITRQIALLPAVSPTQITSDGKSFFSCHGGAVDSIIQFDPVTGAEIRRASLAPTIDNPSGLVFDGKYLWICTIIQDAIYQVSIN